jgi:hypothetical protein
VAIGNSVPAAAVAQDVEAQITVREDAIRDDLTSGGVVSAANARPD